MEMAWTYLDVIGEVCTPKISTTQHKLSGDRIRTPGPHGICGFRMLNWHVKDVTWVLSGPWAPEKMLPVTSNIHDAQLPRRSGKNGSHAVASLSSREPKAMFCFQASNQPWHVSLCTVSWPDWGVISQPWLEG